MTLGEAYQEISNELAAAGIEEARLEARMLLSFAARVDQSRLLGHPEDELPAAKLTKLRKFAKRRKTGEPIAYITGEKEFWSLSFKVTPDTLIPRPDSETLISAVVDNLPDKNMEISILDLGTGSGCLLLALLSELPRATGIGIDINPVACKIARENAANLGLSERTQFQPGNWMDGLNGLFDVIISNPPYIVEADISALDNDVRLYEPHLALSGGIDGLAAYRQIAAQCHRHLTRKGLLAVEIGMEQAIEIKEIFLENNLNINSVHLDIANVERCILATVGKS